MHKTDYSCWRNFEIMESPFKNKNEIDNYVKQLTNEEIAQSLKALNSPVGPVTPTTRFVHRKKLTNLMCKTLPDDSTNIIEQSETNKIESEISKDSETSTKKGNDSTIIDTLDQDKIKSDISKESETPTKESKNVTTVICSSDQSKIKSEISKESEVSTEKGDKKKHEGNLGKYSGVHVPAICNKQGPHVFQDYQAMLKFAKSNPGSRFKLFDCPDKAKEFSTSCDFRGRPFTIIRDEREEDTDDELPTSPCQKENLPFRSIKNTEIVVFRKALETGNVEKIKELAWSNPRYLIGSGDNPTIIHEGCRYNAMHIACKSNQLASCRAVMDIVSNHDFYFLLYREDMPHKRQTRMEFLQDMYLNNREKGLQDTPLHFACKFGHEDIVKYLVSFDMTDKKAKNKEGQTPREIIGSRLKDPPQQLIDSIDAAFEDQYYVFVIRAEDDSEPPQVSLPFCPTQTAYTPVVPSVNPDRHYWDLFKSQSYPVAASRSKQARASPGKGGRGDERSGGGVGDFREDGSPERSGASATTSHTKGDSESNSKIRAHETPRGRKATEDKVSVLCKTPSNKRVIVLADPGSEKTLAAYAPDQDEPSLPPLSCNKSRLSSRNLDRWERMVNMPVFSAREIPRRIRGIAGPMSLDEACMFRNAVLLNGAPKKFKSSMELIKRTDSYKGLERVCRYVACKRGISWSEHWSFLDCEVDLSSPTGLELFEEHMQGVLEFSVSIADPQSAKGREGEDPLSMIFSNLKIKSPTELDGAKSLGKKDGGTDDHVKKRAMASKIGSGVFIYGDIPTRADVDAFRAVKHVECQLENYPCINCWFKNVANFSEAEKSRLLDASTISHILSTPQNKSLNYLRSIKEMQYSPSIKRNLRSLFDNE